MIKNASNQHAVETAILSAEERLYELEMRWILLAGVPQWQNALAVAQCLVDCAPDQPAGWLWRAESLAALNRTEEARLSLVPAVEGFPTLGLIPFEMCRYCCRLGQTREACRWLARALAVGEPAVACLLSSTEPDFDRLWSLLRRGDPYPSQ